MNEIHDTNYDKRSVTQFKSLFILEEVGGGYTPKGSMHFTMKYSFYNTCSHTETEKVTHMRDSAWCILLHSFRNNSATES